MKASEVDRATFAQIQATAAIPANYTGNATERRLQGKQIVGGEISRQIIPGRNVSLPNASTRWIAKASGNTRRGKLNVKLMRTINSPGQTTSASKFTAHYLEFNSTTRKCATDKTPRREESERRASSPPESEESPS